MTTVVEAISDLLFVRDTVVVPGLGAFVKKAVPAKVNPVANYFSMPSSEIFFDANLREDNDLVIRYLSEKNEMPEDEARKLLAKFVSDCFNTLKDKRKLVLNGIGTLSYEADDLVFNQDKSVNYNSDVFGLADFTPQPVLRLKTKAEIKSEIEQQQKDKNTPVTVDEKAVHGQDGPHRSGWPWLLLAVFVVMASLFGLQHFGIINFGQTDHPVSSPDTSQQNPEPIVEQDGQRANQMESDSIMEVVHVAGPALGIPESEFRIIAGCYDQEENARWFANVLRSAGFKNAFYEKRGARWFVAFDHFLTKEDAMAALYDIRANTKYQAWLLAPQE